MKKYFNSIRKHLQVELAKSARDYLKIGLSLYHDRRSIGIQAPIGNLGIAIELMIKTYIAKNNPLLLFQGLPTELKVLFTCPDSSIKSFHWRRFDIDLRSFLYKTIELNECIKIFYIFFSAHRQLLQPYFRFLSDCRNLSVHAAYPSFQIYDLERTVYLALNVHKILNEAKTFEVWAYCPTKKDISFLSSFDMERAERVRKTIEAAKVRSKELKHDISLTSAEGWDEYNTECPICDSEGILTGNSDFHVLGEDETNFEIFLDFSADSFYCSECGLVLNDYKELELAGMDISYDRSSELDEWFEEHGPEPDEF